MFSLQQKRKKKKQKQSHNQFFRSLYILSILHFGQYFKKTGIEGAKMSKMFAEGSQCKTISECATLTRAGFWRKLCKYLCKIIK